MNYAIAKTVKAQLEAAETAAGQSLKSFPKGPMGMTPDAVKASPEFKKAYAEYAAAFAALRNFNGMFFKTFKKEIAADRKAKGR